MNKKQFATELDRVFVTGGAGFIGSALVRYLVGSDLATVLNVDKLTYAGNLESLTPIADKPNYRFLHVDIRDRGCIEQALDDFRPTAVMHLAAESHVDRSIDGQAAFIDTNVVGTCQLLQCVLKYWQGLPSTQQDRFRFHHISTDEVYGSLRIGRMDDVGRWPTRLGLPIAPPPPRDGWRFFLARPSAPFSRGRWPSRPFLKISVTIGTDAVYRRAATPQPT